MHLWIFNSEKSEVSHRYNRINIPEDQTPAVFSKLAVQEIRTKMYRRESNILCCHGNIAVDSREQNSK